MARHKGMAPADISRRVFEEWLARTRPATRHSPDGTRRPYWLIRPLKPSREAYLLPRDPPLRLINGTGIVGSVKAFASATVLGAPTTLRRAVVGRAIRPGRLIADGSGSGPPLTNAEILAASGTMFHPSCTCAIGRADDPMAVVDPECRVYGVASLRVADASVMPSVPSANTNFPTIMIAERVADFIRAARRSG